jgi:hypothetical protein
MENIQMLVRKLSMSILDKRAVSNVISGTVMTGAVIALSLAVFSWSESKALDYKGEFGDAVDIETARLGEKLVFEYISYGNPSYDISVYVINCGIKDNVGIKTVYVSNDTWLETYSTPTLYFLDGTPIPDQDLDVGDEGYVIVFFSSDLSSGYYDVRIVTERGATFGSNFMV